MDSYCCDVAWDEACVELYTYCEQGWPQTIEEPTRDIGVYPNPTNSILNINAPAGSVVTVYNDLGQLVIEATTQTTIDLSHLPKGLYNILIQNESIVVKKAIVKS